jgi:hypothetical protein
MACPIRPRSPRRATWPCWAWRWRSDFPQYYGYFHADRLDLGKRQITGRREVRRALRALCRGLKTGFICASGFNIVGSATRDGRRLIAVALGFAAATCGDDSWFACSTKPFVLKTAGSRSQGLATAQPSRPSRDRAWAGRMWHDPLRHARRRRLARHLRRLAHRPQHLRQGPGRSRVRSA